MLAKRSRLTAVEVRAILEKGRSVRLGSLSAKYCTAKDARAAVVVSKKVAKTAVMRNRLRRAAYRTLQKTPLSRVHAVFFLHTPVFNAESLVALCSKLS